MSDEHTNRRILIVDDDSDHAYYYPDLDGHDYTSEVTGDGGCSGDASSATAPAGES